MPTPTPTTPLKTTRTIGSCIDVSGCLIRSVIEIAPPPVSYLETFVRFVSADDVIADSPTTATATTAQWLRRNAMVPPLDGLASVCLLLSSVVSAC
jgi:hypothetical protein